MEALQGNPPVLAPNFEPDTEKIKQKLLQKGVYASPKIVHSLRKKEIQKHNRRNRRQTHQEISDSENQPVAAEARFQSLKSEYKQFSKAIRAKSADRSFALGRPWERPEAAELKRLASVNSYFDGKKLKKENLRELKEMLEARKLEDMQWVLDDDVELKEDWLADKKAEWEPVRRKQSERGVIQFLVGRLCSREISMNDWKFSRMMRNSGLPFTEGQLFIILDKLGAKSCWKQAVSVVEWVYNRKSYSHYKSRFVYTKLLSVLGMARRPQEALHVFNLMRDDNQIYPDMAAYHSIAVTLGQAGLLRELLKVVEYMRKPSSKIVKKYSRKNWNPILEPDLVVYNSILNACIPSLEWKGVSWVFKQLRKSGLKPNGATYGLAMEVMLKSGKYDSVLELFRKMKKSGEAPKAITYKFLVRAFGKEGKVTSAVDAVRDMEQSGVVGAASVYYELACCLCSSGRWQDALKEVEKIKRVAYAKPLAVTFTGMIASSLDAGRTHDCISIFESMKEYCTPNTGAVNVMLKVYGRNDMFSRAKELFEEMNKKSCSKQTSLDGHFLSLTPDKYTYGAMLEAAASAFQWEYFEHVYREMVISGYQLDQRKSAPLLVKASKAGKGHLLEHAFDAILEAGEIPDAQLFTEMILQATVKQDYQRAVTLVNNLVYTPFQVSERQWTQLFETNRGRIDLDSLEKLLDVLNSYGLASEATVSSLRRALHSVCRPNRVTYLQASGDCTAGPALSSFPGMGCSGDTKREEGAEDTGEMNGTVHPGTEILVYHGEFSLDIACTEPTAVPQLKDHAENFSSAGESGNHSGNNLMGLTVDRRWSDDENDFKLVTGEPHDSCERNLPSADEILEAWKEERKRDGLFFPFQRARSKS